MGKTAYRGYLLTQTFSQGWVIEKNNTLIAWAFDLADAQRQVDSLLD